MYDWANSAFQTTVITAVFPALLQRLRRGRPLTPTEATARFAWATTIAVTITAVIGPILGAIADMRGWKKRLLAASMSVGIVATLLMATISRGDWAYAALVFMIANIGIAVSFVFYDSLLPHIAAPDEMDRVSTAAYAIGYLGGGVLLRPEPGVDPQPGHVRPADTVAAIRLSFVSVAVWWLVLLAAVALSVRRAGRPARVDERRRANAVRARLGATCGRPFASCAAIARRF